MDNLEIKVVKPESTDLLHLIGKLDLELLERYPEEAVHGIDFNDPNLHEVVFTVAYLNDLPVGCGAIRPLDGESAELKRFFVERPYRNRGIAASLLAFLEKKAQELFFGISGWKPVPSSRKPSVFMKNTAMRRSKNSGNMSAANEVFATRKQLDDSPFRMVASGAMFTQGIEITASLGRAGGRRWTL